MTIAGGLWEITRADSGKSKPLDGAERNLYNISLAVCRAYKEILGLPDRNYNKDDLFGDLTAQ